MSKVLVIVPIKDIIEKDCLEAINAQTYPFELLVNKLEPIQLDADSEKNRVKNIVRNRNICKEKALASDAEYFLWVDSDVVLPKDAIEKLVNYKSAIVGGWYRKMVGNDWVAGNFVKSGVMYLYKDVQKGLLSVDLLGLGCCMMSRKVLEQTVFDGATEETNYDTEGRKYFYAECMKFCQDSITAGFQPKLSGDVVCVHIKKLNDKRGIPMKNIKDMTELELKAAGYENTLMLADLNEKARGIQAGLQMINNELQARAKASLEPSVQPIAENICCKG